MGYWYTPNYDGNTTAPDPIYVNDNSSTVDIPLLNVNKLSTSTTSTKKDDGKKTTVDEVKTEDDWSFYTNDNLMQYSFILAGVGGLVAFYYLTKKS
jgi:hypothetical protein